jgi:hypothetical protein
MNFPKSPLVEHSVRRPVFSLEKNGFTRVNATPTCGIHLAQNTASPKIHVKISMSKI